MSEGEADIFSYVEGFFLKMRQKHRRNVRDYDYFHDPGEQRKGLSSGEQVVHSELVRDLEPEENAVCLPVRQAQQYRFGHPALYARHQRLKRIIVNRTRPNGLHPVQYRVKIGLL